MHTYHTLWALQLVNTIKRFDVLTIIEDQDLPAVAPGGDSAEGSPKWKALLAEVIFSQSDTETPEN